MMNTDACLLAACLLACLIACLLVWLVMVTDPASLADNAMADSVEGCAGMQAILEQPVDESRPLIAGNGQRS